MTEVYLAHLTNNVYELIENYFSKNKKDEHIIIKHFTNRLQDPKFKSFQKYYFETLSNKEHFYSDKQFFREFKQKYSLQGMDSNYLRKTLEQSKMEMLHLLEEEKLSELYFKYFFKIPTQYNEDKREKNFGSFFTKFVHTFNPEKYTAVDNPIKNYFGLEKESFFVSMIIISEAYHSWSSNNKPRIAGIKQVFKAEAKRNEVPIGKVTDMKLLNLIFWSETNPQ